MKLPRDYFVVELGEKKSSFNLKDIKLKEALKYLSVIYEGLKLFQGKSEGYKTDGIDLEETKKDVIEKLTSYENVSD